MNNKNIYFVLMLSFKILTIGASDFYKLKYLNSLLPDNIDLRERVLTTLYCDDCCLLPRVEGAGKIQKDEVLNIEYQIMHNGVKVYKDCYYGTWMTKLIELAHGFHEPQEEKIFHDVLKLLPENPVMIELGAYWGYYSLWFKKYFPKGLSYIVEPDPKNIIIGKNNFILNNMEAYFEQAMIDCKSSQCAEFIDWDYNKHNIPSISIDDFAKQHNIPFIHILHSDIQGAEVAMLHGCCELMKEQRIGYYFISTHRGVHEQCLDILQYYNLDILVSITRDESFSADGLIVAKLSSLPIIECVEITKRTEYLKELIKTISTEIINE